VPPVWRPRSAGLAAEIKNRFGIDVELIKGRDGVFEINVDDQLIFSKKSTGRFPETGEVKEALAGVLDTD
jgi:selenoprotein W-related protein